MFKNNDGVDIYNSKNDNEWEDKVTLGIKTMHHLPPQLQQGIWFNYYKRLPAEKGNDWIIQIEFDNINFK